MESRQLEGGRGFKDESEGVARARGSGVKQAQLSGKDRSNRTAARATGDDASHCLLQHGFRYITLCRRMRTRLSADNKVRNFSAAASFPHCCGKLTSDRQVYRKSYTRLQRERKGPALYSHQSSNERQPRRSPCFRGCRVSTPQAIVVDRAICLSR